MSQALNQSNRLKQKASGRKVFGSSGYRFSSQVKLTAEQRSVAVGFVQSGHGAHWNEIYVEWRQYIILPFFVNECSYNTGKFIKTEEESKFQQFFFLNITTHPARLVHTDKRANL